MNLTVAYRGRSGIFRRPDAFALSLAPNLRRDRVSFDGVLNHPVRFREAICALHDVVVSDLRHQPKDRSAYEAYLKEEAKRLERLQAAAREYTKDRALKEFPAERRESITKRYHQLKSTYWNAREKWGRYIQEHDWELFRLVVPMDPVITVAPDVLFFECFSADESSYGCLTVDRNGFRSDSDVSLGTTNVDYSWELYDHFQELRSYRRTEFRIDPTGFDVSTTRNNTDPATAYREEKIDLPPSWLRGFMQLQSAMSLPLLKVPMPAAMLYNLLSFLKRNRARKSPRALRFDLKPGEPVKIIIEPFEQVVTSPEAIYQGSKAETVRIWGRDRLQSLARLLPLVESAEVHLLGTGLPSFWSLNLGDMRFLLGLSGWTKNDWAGASALDALAPPVEPSADLIGRISAGFQKSPSMTFREAVTASGGSPAETAAGLNRLALLGQLIHDMPSKLYRWRSILPVSLSLSQISPDNPETIGATELVRRGQVTITRDEITPTGFRALTGNCPERPTEILIDKDQKITRGKCTCSFFYQFGIRRGPCRHMQALRTVALKGGGTPSLDQWFAGLNAGG
ncbi:hypothetical protein [Tuwongella immobilis]|uniref:Zinc finger swim domain protein: Uncharacterized protein n=1 Tax=Tuwongella immobilis TaxID=692036 RepID=A0A6C2YQF1_9BACT|nr:hypothetical protein [Tuwongella immobilis]VIP03868.1 zinc finger swim domain protein : Uncharacterized protein OS=Singulisphaera acidiphila (strain ATCC BAA-1392 / DSM 18658 / VKM B-2454 / MOB10) GN=Sinac_4397 PE=4 SV=1 [Tuwongella immobilis]VTS05103.1 zinc finger swim domain protein : Uncharacterized protein OS=Singulisphaera acidiphila (strain ATCC BAA-1392 / DSM 18658 / VKM B-2454 / MOB10) GN=Sinac_4397 PE=4 SV=1 [Tuwongella immobilis]